MGLKKVIASPTRRASRVSLTNGVWSAPSHTVRSRRYSVSDSWMFVMWVQVVNHIESHIHGNQTPAGVRVLVVWYDTTAVCLALRCRTSALIVGHERPSKRHCLQSREKDLQGREKDCERAFSRASQAEAALAEAKQVSFLLCLPDMPVWDSACCVSVMFHLTA